MKLGWLERSILNHVHSHKPMWGCEINWMHPLSDHLVACYLLNEERGTIVYDMAQHKRGVGIDPPGSLTSSWSYRGDVSPSWTCGTGLAASVGGLRLPAEMPAHISIELWINYNQPWSNHDASLGWMGDFYGNYGYHISGLGGAHSDPMPIHWSVRGAGGTSAKTIDIPIPFGHWFHLVCTADDTTVKAYVNGALAANDIYGGPIDYFGIPDSTNLIIGNHAEGAAQGFPGQIGLVRVWDKALTGDEASWLCTEPYANIYYPGYSPSYSIVEIPASVWSTSGCMFYFNPPIPVETQQPINPQVILKWSDDGGFTYGNEHLRPIGRIGQNKYRIRWPGSLGRARDRVWWIEVDDPIKIELINAYLDATPGLS